MRSVEHLRADDVRAQPWKNGGGVTRELAVWPAGARLERGDFEWRISAALIRQAGPFSAFPGLERILVLTHGAGLILEHGDAAARARLRPFEPYRFAGAWPTTCAPTAGAAEDFGVMFRSDRWRVDVEALALGRRRAREGIGAGHAFAHVLGGAVTARVAGEEEPFVLDPGESLWVRDLVREEELEFAGDTAASVVLLVRLAPEGAR